MSRKNSTKPRKTRKSRSEKAEPSKETGEKDVNTNTDDNQDYGGMNMSNFRKNLGCG